jgi:hypothetical protein
VPWVSVIDQGKLLKNPKYVLSWFVNSSPLLVKRNMLTEVGKNNIFFIEISQYTRAGVGNSFGFAGRTRDNLGILGQVHLHETRF